jgi:hypothetical protein
MRLRYRLATSASSPDAALARYSPIRRRIYADSSRLDITGEIRFQMGDEMFFARQWL